MSQRQSGPHMRAAKESIGHIGQYILMTLEQLLLRVISMSPLIYALISRQFFGIRKEYVMGAALLCCLPLWILLVLPARFRLGAKLGSWFGIQMETGSWSDRLAKGLVYFSKSFLLVLPIFICLYILYYSFSFSGFPVFLGMIEYPGKLLTGLLGEGLPPAMLIGGVIWVLFLVLLTFLAFWGWRRFTMPYFFLPEGGRIKQRASQSLGKTIGLNFLIILPPLLIVLALLGLSLAPKLSGSMMYDLLTIVSAITSFDFPAHTLSLCAVVLALLYLPFVLFRKAAIAASLYSHHR